jgi:hypothetical protein
MSEVDPHEIAEGTRLGDERSVEPDMCTQGLAPSGYEASSQEEGGDAHTATGTAVVLWGDRRFVPVPENALMRLRLQQDETPYSRTALSNAWFTPIKKLWERSLFSCRRMFFQRI